MKLFLLPSQTAAQGHAMNKRYFWGTPHTDTDVDAFEAATRARAADVAAGKYAAVSAMEHALERLARRSAGLLQFEALFAIVVVLLGYRAGTAAPANFMQFTQWSFVLALVSCLLLLPNLFSTWTSHPGTDARQEYLSLMSIHKMRAPRYTIAMVFAMVALLLTLYSLTQLA